MGLCRRCGKSAGWLLTVCAECTKVPFDPYAGASNESEYEVDHQDHSDLAGRILLTTIWQIPGYRVVEHLDIVTAECVFGMNIFRDFFAGVRDVFGGRSEATQKVLRDARRLCLFELRKEASVLGANAVLGVNLHYNEFSGGNKSMLFLVASGTAVLIERGNRS